MLTFRFSGVDGTMVEPEILTSGMVGKKVKLEFSEEWEGLTKTAVFTAGSVTRDVVCASGEVVIPAEVLQRPLQQLYVGVYGVSEGGTVMPTIRAEGPQILPGIDPSGDRSADPDLPIWAQLGARITNLEEDGSDCVCGGNTEEIPAYWKSHLDAKIDAIKELQRAGGKDCYSFVVVADYHRYGNIGKRSPLLIHQVMDACGIRFCLCLGDIQNGGAWKTKKLELAEWEEIEKEFAPIRDRTLMIPGNHDGAYGSADINGDGVISGTTDYYIYNLTPDEMYDLVNRKVGLIPGVTFDKGRNGYYVDDAAAKVRYILLNTHYSDGAANDDGTAINNYMRKMRIGQDQQNMVIEALQSVPDKDWHVVVGAHMPLAVFRGEGGGGDLPLLRSVLTAYQNKTVYSGTFGTQGAYDYVAVDVNFKDARGCVIGTFAGHLHEDLSSADYAFPIICTSSDDTSSAKIDGVSTPGKAGTITEQSFDVFTVNKRTGTIHATKIGCGANRVFTGCGNSGEGSGNVTAYTNLADPTSEEWIESALYTNGDISAKEGMNWRATNLIPVTQYDILRFKGLNITTSDAAYYPRLVLYDETKTYFSLLAFTESGMNSIVPVISTDENGVTSYEILMRGSTGQQFVYDNWCTKVKYVRFYCCNDTPAEDVIITINEEIV